jgi:stress response protein SCP2
VGPTAAQLARAERAATKAQHDAERDAAIAQLKELRWSSTTVHLQDFPRASPPVIAAAPVIPAKLVAAQALAYHLNGVGRFARGERSLAKQRAEHDARAYVADEQRRLSQVHELVQAEAGQWWASLVAGDEDIVCEAVNAAFADNPAAGCAVGVEGSTLSIVMRQQDVDSLPGQIPGLTSAGRPTLKSLTKKDRIGWWLNMLASNVVATCKEAFATAPSISQVSVAVLTRMPDTQRLGIVAYGTWTRQAIETSRWQTPEDAFRMFDLGTAVACSVRTTASGALSTSIKPLDVSTVPALAALLDTNAVDEGVNPLADLDNTLAASQIAQSTDPATPNPYALTPFDEWVSGRSVSSHETQQIVNSGALGPGSEAVETVHLAPGQTIALPEDAVYQADVSFSFSGADTDLTLLMLEHSGKVGGDHDLVFYNQPVAAGNSIQLQHKTINGTGVTERAALYLAAVPPRIAKIAVSISMDVDTGLTCAALNSPHLTVSSSAGRWEFTPTPDPTIKAMIVAEIYRHTTPQGAPIWKLRALGQGWAGGLSELALAHGVHID